MQIKEITVLNYKEIDHINVLDAFPIEKISNFIFELDVMNEPETARGVFVWLSNMIAQSDDPETFAKKYFNELVALRLMFLVMVPDVDKVKFLNENIVSVLEQDYCDIKKYIKNFYSIVGYDEEIIKGMTKNFTAAIESSNNLIGTTDITVMGKHTKPFVKSWINDYKIFPSIRQKRISIDHLQYINQSVNVRSLSKHERDLLLSLIRLYDWLRFESTAPGWSDEFQKLLSRGQFDGKKNVQLEEYLKKVQTPQVPKPPVTSKFELKMTPDEIKREVDTEELPPHQQQEQNEHVGTAGFGLKNLPTLRPGVKLNTFGSVTAPKSESSGIKNLPTMRPMPPGMFASSAAPSRSTPISKGVLPVPKPPRANIQPPTPAIKVLPLTSVANIGAIEDFKKVDVSLLRQGSAASNIETIKQKISQVAHDQRSFPALAVQAFEQSPLFKLYLNLGAEMLLDHSADRKVAYANASKKLSVGGLPVLTLQEFEMVADLKKEIERL
jgi:hypothetical protein